MAAIHPADLAELLDDLPREDRLVLFEALPGRAGRGGSLGAQGRDAPADPPHGLPHQARADARPARAGRRHRPPRAPDPAPARGHPREDVAARRGRGRAAAALPAAHRGPAHDHQVRYDPARVDGRGDAGAPASASIPRSRRSRASMPSTTPAGSSATSRCAGSFPRPPERKIADMMERRLLTVRPDTDQEEVARHGLQVRRARDPGRRREPEAPRDRDGRRRHRHPDRGADPGRPAPRRRLGHRGGGRAGLLRGEALAERPPAVQLAAAPVRRRRR